MKLTFTHYTVKLFDNGHWQIEVERSRQSIAELRAQYASHRVKFTPHYSVSK